MLIHPALGKFVRQKRHTAKTVSELWILAFTTRSERSRPPVGPQVATPCNRITCSKSKLLFSYKTLTVCLQLNFCFVIK